MPRRAALRRAVPLCAALCLRPWACGFGFGPWALGYPMVFNAKMKLSMLAYVWLCLPMSAMRAYVWLYLRCYLSQRLAVLPLAAPCGGTPYGAVPCGATPCNVSSLRACECARVVARGNACMVGFLHACVCGPPRQPPMPTLSCITRVCIRSTRAIASWRELIAYTDQSLRSICNCVSGLDATVIKNDDASWLDTWLRSRNAAYTYQFVSGPAFFWSGLDFLVCQCGQHVGALGSTFSPRDRHLHPPVAHVRVGERMTQVKLNLVIRTIQHRIPHVATTHSLRC